MNSKITIDDRNKISVMLMQALWGAISPNFRMVALYPNEPTWKLLFVLEQDSTTDREEIEDVTAEFDALLLDLDTLEIKFEVDILISAEMLSWPESPSFVVFRRREEPVTRKP